jgi:hypothetical protein
MGQTNQANATCISAHFACSTSSDVPQPMLNILLLIRHFPQPCYMHSNPYYIRVAKTWEHREHALGTFDHLGNIWAKVLYLDLSNEVKTSQFRKNTR